MVGGYQGGEPNPLTGHVVVRQYDAHAWTEVWLDGRGWVRFDPTAAVAPARIESGLDAALSETDRAVFAALTGSRFEGMPGLRDVMYLFESMQHRWNMWVVGYDSETQARYLADLLGKVTPMRVGLVMLLGGGMSLGLVVLSLFWRRRTAPDHPAQRAFRRFTRRLVRTGLTRMPHETPGRFLAARQCGAQSRFVRYFCADRSSGFAALQSGRSLQQRIAARVAQRSASAAARCRVARAFVVPSRGKSKSCVPRRASASVRQLTVT